jgi:thiol-disulfide isomerase/thioredoxin
MQLKKLWPWLIAVLITGAIFGLKTYTSDSVQPVSDSTQVTGPAVILFRGDNSPSCRAIHRLVDEAEQHYGDSIVFRQFDWSENNPLIQRYQVRFLPTALLIDRNGKELVRTVGESPAVQEKLKKMLTNLDSILKL